MEFHNEPQPVHTFGYGKPLVERILEDILTGINKQSGGVIDRSVTDGDPYNNFVDEILDHIAARAKEVAGDNADAHALMASVLVGGALGYISQHVEIRTKESAETDALFAKFITFMKEHGGADNAS